MALYEHALQNLRQILLSMMAVSNEVACMFVKDV